MGRLVFQFCSATGNLGTKFKKSIHWLIPPLVSEPANAAITAPAKRLMPTISHDLSICNRSLSYHE